MCSEPTCVVDSSRPCRACSAPGPWACPYLYIMGWDAQQPDAGAESAALDGVGADLTDPAAPR